MIVTGTPFRVTLGGGGTDLPSFYSQHGGFVLAMAIDKFMYIVLNTPNADRHVRLHYANSETVRNIDELKHDLAREALRRHSIYDAIDVASVADLPAASGLGSSSCYLVGLLTALRTYVRRPVSLMEIAEEACDIELNVLQKQVGKQDQYMAAFGGLTALEIDPSGKVEVTSLPIEPSNLATFVANTHLYYTGVQRNASEILAQQDNAMRTSNGVDRTRVEDSLVGIKNIGYQIRDAIRDADFDQFGRLMDEHWQLKRRMSERISLSRFDQLYEQVKCEYGVLGGKIVGAGGGGFMMLYCPKDHQRLMNFMHEQGLMRVHYDVEFEGARVITNVFNAQSMHVHPQVAFSGSQDRVTVGASDRTR